MFCFSETLSAAFRGPSLSPWAVALFQDTWGENHKHTRSHYFHYFWINQLSEWQIRDSISSLASFSSSVACLSRSGCGQLSALCAWCLWKGQSVDDRLWEDGSPGGTSDPGPQESLGGGQQGGWLPVGTGQHHRHFQQYAPADTLKKDRDSRQSFFWEFGPFLKW